MIAHDRSVRGIGPVGDVPGTTAGNDCPLLDQAGSSTLRFGVDEVEGAESVVRSPAAAVVDSRGDVPKLFAG